MHQCVARNRGCDGFVLRRALVVRRFQSLSVQDICQFVIIGLLTGCATDSLVLTRMCMRCKPVCLSEGRLLRAPERC